VSRGLAPRPELGPEETAALVAAVAELLGGKSAVVVDQVPVWRFSGRWFNTGPYSLRRPHHLN
jgi:hypothetical protein